MRNYYSGCSTGGRQGIRQNPDSFDGMLIGAPAWNVKSAMPVISRIGWIAQAYGLQVPDRTLLERIYNRVNEICTVLGFDNTAADGVVRDTAECLSTFKASGVTGPVWSGLDCADSLDCVTIPQREGFMALLEEFKLPPLNQTYAGDGVDITSIKDLFTFLGGSQPTDFDQQFSRYFLNETIVWDSDENGARLISRSNEWDAEVRANANASILNGWSGKTILYTGTADATVSSNGTRRAFGMAGGIGNNNLAFFELPGMPHCVNSGTGVSGGANPPWYIGGVGLLGVSPSNQWYMPNTTTPALNNAEHDALHALTEWVEAPNSSKPTQLIATAFNNWGPGFTIAKERPICAAPMRQDYVSGNADAKGSWRCV